MTLYVNPHRTQYDGVPADIHSGCTWTSGANGADASTGGRVSKTPAQIHALVHPGEETNPATPGWSIADLDLAMARLNVPFTPISGRGWVGVVAALMGNHYVALQGDSDQFTSGCSGDFDGNHCIGIHPKHKTASSGIQFWVNDPICPTGRWENVGVLRDYGEKLSSGILAGQFELVVPMTVWADDVRADNQAVDPLGHQVAAAIRKTHHSYGTVVNTVDIKTAMKAAHLKYGTVIDPPDVRSLLRWAKKH
jgi:hypothetical protein